MQTVLNASLNKDKENFTAIVLKSMPKTQSLNSLIRMIINNQNSFDERFLKQV